MPSKVRAIVTPELMVWAREKRARLTLEAAAKKIGRPKEEIEGWENGTLKPTMPQARNAEEAYRVPLACFYMEKPPKGFAVLRDFRFLPDEYSPEYSPKLSLLAEETQDRQQWMRDYLIMEGRKRLDFVGSADVTMEPRDLAKSIRKTLKTTPDDQISCSSRSDALKLWMQSAEQAGIFVSRARDVSCLEARGFAICDPYAPIIFLNTNDSKAAQFFTLAHELVHIWINQTGVSNLEDIYSMPDTDEARIEIFCNKVAAEAVLDSKTFNHLWAERSKNRTINEQIEVISGVFKVSEEVVARRLLDKDVISQHRYRELREYYQERWKEMEEKKKKGFAPYHLRMVVKRGYTFTQLVLGAYYRGSAAATEASALLGAKVNHFNKVAYYAHLPEPPSQR
ncbi:ImmA/IrrE family metallo-endopeptidase [candidate division TA06 bacterium]|uniref:ImmA/IrrE family metallo-endopeptidase n=1 Tax=candidate division TA06 bacterium TaxID=2250710 RepID=A0A523USH5_UNCT6|nr:MAG: ImmA/IrrE family metallo-endopeptidase [candidate division TA06 bacterium]